MLRVRLLLKTLGWNLATMSPVLSERWVAAGTRSARVAKRRGRV
jgi:hypothetical protein